MSQQSGELGPRPPGVNSQLIQEVVLPESAQQALRDIRITPCDSLAHRQCTWALYWNHPSTHLGAHHSNTAYIFLGDTLLAGVMCKTIDHSLILEGALVYELISLTEHKTELELISLEHQGELLTELNDPLEGSPQVHPVNDHTCQFLFALITGQNHDDQVGCVDSLSLTSSSV